jgi:hypothetical protein
MPFEGLELLAVNLPQFDGFVVTSRRDRFAIGTKGYAINKFGMPFKRLEDLAINAP